jgi:hypothetical protein
MIKDELDPLVYEELSDEAIVLEVFNDCVVGVGSVFPHTHSVLIYDVGEMVISLMKKDGMDMEEAMEFYAYNIAGLCVGDGTPIFMSDKIIDRAIVMQPL